jgi:hypothetical protein
MRTVLPLQLVERLLGFSSGCIVLELTLPIPREVLSPITLLVLSCAHKLYL